ncbi:MAG: SEL1-like repeat protein [Rhodospirillales bacterium]|nr:SEL1-like repeat protein [Rhodospirillales bacterium]USO08440.1 MAG: SEL1-like repeat protein [Rhodospirillales bacterium]
MRPTNAAPAAKPESTPRAATAASPTPAANARPFPVSNANMAATDQVRAALDTLGIKLIKSEAERDVLKKLVEETRSTQTRLERELLENRKELAETRRKMEDQRQDSELTRNRHERLEEKLREAQANNLKIARKIEADDQKRARIQRRMERLERVAQEAQSALQSRAMVLLTDQSLAEQSGLPRIAASGEVLPVAAPARTAHASSLIGSGTVIDAGETEELPWWKKPLNLNASAALGALVFALGLGWVISYNVNASQTAVAVMADGSLARIDLKTGTLQPLQLKLKTLDQSTAAPVARVSTDGAPLPASAKPDDSAVSATAPAAAPERDPSLTGALKELEDKAYAGQPEAEHDLAAIYTAGSGVKQDYTRAAYWFRQAADAGIANAAYNLGVLNHQGLGVDKNIDRALDWYRIAALEGHPEAQYNLGIAYIEGIGTKYNPQLAAGFFQKAALSGINEAAYNLGLILENGLLAEPKPNQALIWYRVGAQGGSTEARNALDQLASRLGLSPDKAGFLPDGTSLAKLVHKPESAQPGSNSDATAELARLMPDLAEMIPDTDQLITAQVQEQLTRRDIYDGPEDGAASPKTADAIKSYERRNDIKVDGKANADLLMKMLRQSVVEDSAKAK